MVEDVGISALDAAVFLVWLSLLGWVPAPFYGHSPKRGLISFNAHRRC